MSKRIPFKTMTGEIIYPGDVVVYIGSSYGNRTRVRVGLYCGENVLGPAVASIQPSLRCGPYLSHATLQRGLVFKTHNPTEELARNFFKNYSQDEIDQVVRTLKKKGDELRKEYDELLTLFKDLIKLEVKEIS